ncbi:hypothetical protein OG21DRAFT_1489720 [Imleria badia]|nr:hypothetical protein OG21DRAFT_1489720 [Imleria badia]
MQPYYLAWALPVQPGPSPQLAAPVAAPVIKQEQLTLRRAGPQLCAFCADPTHFMGSCPHVDAYIQSGRATCGSDNCIYLPDGRRIPCVPGTNCLKECLDRLAAPAATPIISSAITTGLFSLTCPDTDTVLDIDPSVFWSSVHRDDDRDDDDSALKHPNFQPYITQALANFKADKDKASVGCRGDHVTSNPSRSDYSDSILLKYGTGTHNISSSSTTNNHKEYSCPIEDKTAPCQILDRVLETTVPIPVKDLLSVAPEFRKQLRELATTKRIPVTGNVVQVNKLSGRDPHAIDQEFGDRVHRNDDGLIVAHHSIALHCIKAKVVGTGRTINAVLDSGSEIVAMPKRVWEGLGLPVCSDHIMTMSNANTSTDSTISVVENLALDFGAREVYLQVQIVPRANFDLLLGRPFQCLLSATTEDFPDGAQLLTLRDPNTGKAYKIPTCAWTEGCPRCQRRLPCTNHQSIVEVGL